MESQETQCPWNEDEVVNFLIDEMDNYQTPWDDAITKACEEFGIPDKAIVVQLYKIYIGD